MLVTAYCKLCTQIKPRNPKRNLNYLQITTTLVSSIKARKTWYNFQTLTIPRSSLSLEKVV